MRQKGLLHGYEKETIGNSHLRGGTCVAVAGHQRPSFKLRRNYQHYRFVGCSLRRIENLFPDKVEQTDGADKSAPNAAKPEEKKQPEPKQDSTPKPEEKKQSEPSTGNPELDAILKQGAQSVSKIQALNDEIPDFKLSAQIKQIEILTEKIFAYVKEHPQDMGQIRQFLNYYLPTTIKLLEQYVVLQNQGMRMGNIDEGMKKIEDMLDKVIVAFQRQLDSLFESSVVDITADIQVMEQMMASEGLTGKDF